MYRKPLKYRASVDRIIRRKYLFFCINYTETSFYKSAQFAGSGSRMFPKIVDFSDVCAVSMNYHLRYCSPKHFSIFTTVGGSSEFCTRIKTTFGPKKQSNTIMDRLTDFQTHKEHNFQRGTGGWKFESIPCF